MTGCIFTLAASFTFVPRGFFVTALELPEPISSSAAATQAAPSPEVISTATAPAAAAAVHVLSAWASVRPAFALLSRHPRRLLAGAAALMLGSAGAAWAVATLGPDPSSIPRQRVSFEVPSLVSGESLAQLDTRATFSLYRSDVTRSGDTAEALLARLGVADLEASAFLRTNPTTRTQLLGRAGRMVRVETTQSHQLQRLTARWVANEASGEFQRLVVERMNAPDASAPDFRVRLETAPLQTGTRLAGGVIQTSLFAATDAADIPDSVATQIADVFSEINFHRLFRGDRFTLVYETLEADGEILRSGRILAAEFRNRGKIYNAVWFEDEQNQDKSNKNQIKKSRGAYYALDGSSLRRSYLNSPVEFSRISSGFSMRMHPIHKVWRKHLGVDYAAPTGTRVRTIGDGVVDFAGWQNGFGNVVYVRHNNRAHVTVYAHLSRIDVKVGQNVDQNETIGLVGATGWATGPHLHFEFRVNGEHKDPQALIAELPTSEPVLQEQRKRFDQALAIVKPQLEAADLIYQATAQ